jgi:hypothetical protein
LLYNKIKEKDDKEKNIDINLDDGSEENVIEEEEKDDEYIINRRYLIDTNNKLIKNLLPRNFGKNYKRRVSSNNDHSDNIDKEEIVFSTEQFCKKCGNIKNISTEDLIQNQINSNLDIFKYKCEKCKEIEDDIIIKYQILLSNLHKKEAIVCGQGEYKLLTPYKLYINIKSYFQKRKNYELNIPNIFNEKEINLPIIIFYFSVVNLSFDFLLPYKLDEEEKNAKKEENSEQKEFIPIKINYNNDDVYRRFNNLIEVLSTRKRFHRRNNNPIQPFTIKGQAKETQIQNQ